MVATTVFIPEKEITAHPSHRKVDDLDVLAWRDDELYYALAPGSQSE